MKNRYNGLDHAKLIASVFVIAIHTGPLEQINPLFDHLLVNGIARVAVPLFFMITGFFTLYGNSQNRGQRVKVFIKKMGMIYLFSTLLYLPLILYNNSYLFPKDALLFLKDFFFEGTFYHLWYLPAAMLGTYIIHISLKYLSLKKIVILSLALYIFALLGDGYYGVVQNIPALSFIYERYFQLFEYTRIGFLFTPIFLVLGIISRVFSRKNKLTRRLSALGFFLSLLLLLIESYSLDHLHLQKHTSMYIMLLPTMFFLFQWLIKIKVPPCNLPKELSLIVYIIHPWMILLVHLAAKIPFFTAMLSNHFIQFLLVTLLSFSFAYLIAPLLAKSKIKRQVPLRAWSEINYDTLSNNYHSFQQLLPQQTQLYPVIKADAYGHGAIKIARNLQRAGATGFCVATLSEAIDLRKGGINKDILILGFTEPSAIDLIKKYKLIQTIVNREHLATMLPTNIPIRAHLKIDTGMHRLGFLWSEHATIINAVKEKKLHVEGIFTHFSSADSPNQEDIDFTYKQIERFDTVVQALKSNGITHLLTHAQATYGAINYPELHYDIARIGGGLFLGLDKDAIITQQVPNIHPIMQIHARITSVQHIAKGEGVGYNNAFIAPSDMKVATIAIGYADGMPQQLARGIGQVQIGNQLVPIIGKICMDQLMVDCSMIFSIQQGDLALIISNKLDAPNSIINASKTCHIHQNEFASRLGERLKQDK